MREIAYAKVNLALHVRRRRHDGYHELETVFAFCEDGDVIEGELADTAELTIDGPFARGLSTTDNLMIDAARAIGVTARLRLAKTLPVAGGIGGGSADAAATLRLLSQLSGRALPALGEQRMLGADVPACVVSRTLRGEGVGERLTHITPVTGMPILLVNPQVALSTAAVFAAWDGCDRGPLIRWQDGRNDLELPARTLVPEIADVLDWLQLCSGVTTARMSGSGATCFALFDTVAARDSAADRLARLRPEWWAMRSVLR